MMRLTYLLCLTFVLMQLSTATRAEQAPTTEPVHATVVTAGAAVRSGPSESHYLTDTLAQDADVEVYEQRPDGWCAIRPPAESFSWVYAPHLTVTDDELAEINKENVAARVGSRLSSQRDIVQVRLRKGEVVQVLGKDDGAATGWYKIAPPAGEFRWVHAKDLAIKGAAPAPSPVAGARYDEAVSPAAHETASGVSPPNGWTPIAAPPLASSTLMSPTAPAASAAILGSQSPMAATSAITPVAITPLPPGEMAQQLNELELRLSRMVAEPMATWNIESLEQSAETLLSRANSVEERTAVKGTLAKIDRFAGLKRRAANMNGAVAHVAAANVPTSAGIPTGTTIPVIQGETATPVDGTTPTTANPYDAVGILRPVVSRRPGAPQFALVDDQGQVVTFITATPDTNLQPYLGRRIGVTGSRGYIPEFRRPHVTAGRVTPLNDRLLR